MKSLKKSSFKEYGDVIFEDGDLTIIKLLRPLEYVKYIAIREIQGEFLYYNSKGDINEFRAIQLLRKEHRQVPDYKFHRWMSITTMVYREKKALSMDDTGEITLTPERRKEIHAKLKKRLRLQYEARQSTKH